MGFELEIIVVVQSDQLLVIHVMPTAEEEAMTNRTAQIRLPDGSTVQAVDDGDAHLDADSEARLTEVAEEVLEAAGRPLPDHLRTSGRPSLHGGSGHSPTVAFRLSPAVREQAEEVARRRGITVSQLAREALEREIAS